VLARSPEQSRKKQRQQQSADDRMGLCPVIVESVPNRQKSPETKSCQDIWRQNQTADVAGDSCPSAFDAAKPTNECCKRVHEAIADFGPCLPTSAWAIQF